APHGHRDLPLHRHRGQQRPRATPSRRIPGAADPAPRDPAAGGRGPSRLRVPDRRRCVLRRLPHHDGRAQRGTRSEAPAAAPDLPQDFPRLQTLSSAPSNLPVALNTFVGRTEELQAVKERLGQARLLTLLGTGGTGKTRLAIQAASDVRDEYEDRVYFADLAS